MFVCFVDCCFVVSGLFVFFVVALFVAFFYVAVVAASCFFVAAATALSCCVCRNAQNLKWVTVEKDLLSGQEDTPFFMGVSVLCFAFVVVSSSFSTSSVCFAVFAGFTV